VTHKYIRIRFEAVESLAEKSATDLVAEHVLTVAEIEASYIPIFTITAREQADKFWAAVVMMKDSHDRRPYPPKR
jgi:hypothetical protein